MENETGQAWLEAHKHRAEELICYFYALAALSAVAIVLPIYRPKFSLPLLVAVLLFGAVVLGMGGYIAYAGGKIRPRELRKVPPPPTRSPERYRHTDNRPRSNPP